MLPALLLVTCLAFPASPQRDPPPLPPRIRSIKFVNLPVSVDEILARLRERKIDFAVEQRYDPKKVDQVKEILRELLREKRNRQVEVAAEVRPIPPRSVEIVFTGSQ